MNAFRHALRAGFTIEEIFNLTKIDCWFLVHALRA
jgi:Carbamoyl-phosphate synthetase large chain, oligomerisation domain